MPYSKSWSYALQFTEKCGVLHCNLTENSGVLLCNLAKKCEVLHCNLDALRPSQQIFSHVGMISWVEPVLSRGCIFPTDKS